MADEIKTEKSELDLDLDAFSARQLGSGRHLKFEGARYPMRGIYDLGVEQVVQLMGLNNRLQEQSYDKQLAEMRDAVAILAPTMPREALDRMSGRLLSQVLKQVFGVAEEGPDDRPTEGGGAI